MTFSIASSSLPCELSLFRRCRPAVDNRLILICSNFKSFAELDFGCHINNLSKIVQEGFQPRYNVLSLAPKTPQIFDLSISPSHLTILDPRVVYLYMYHLTGVELFAQFFTHDQNSKFLMILDSVFEVYANGTLLTANHPIIARNQSMTVKSTLFSSFYSFIIFRPSVVFKKFIHPLVFKDLNVRNVQVFGLVDSFLRFNMMRFMPTPELSDQIENPFNTTICQMSLHVHEVKIDRNLLNSHVHSQLEFLEVSGKIVEIIPDFYRLVPKLNLLSLKVPSLRSFFHRTNLKWLRVLDSMSRSGLVRYVYFEQLGKSVFNFETGQTYVLPRSKVVIEDFDFCIFADFNLSANTIIEVSSFCSFI